MFDPFRDFATAGYLRNNLKEKEPLIIKRIEHEMFMRKFPKAIQHLSTKRVITYKDFLVTHKILFSEFYPWSGQDRADVMPDGAVSKSGILFSHPRDIRRAIEEGLRIGQAKNGMINKPGEVMGLFAYGHPFLDGNGRTMLLVHLELSYRSEFSITWSKTNKADYLKALSDEINQPGIGILDGYLHQFKEGRMERNSWGAEIIAMKGLDGLDEGNQIDGNLSDPAVAEKYRQFEQQRSYSYENYSGGACKTCNAIPCICGGNKRGNDGGSSGPGI